MRLLLNEQINPAVAAELRRKGYGVVSASELGTRGANDWEQLSAAVAAHRALVTYNIADFRRLLAEVRANEAGAPGDQGPGHGVAVLTVLAHDRLSEWTRFDPLPLC